METKSSIILVLVFLNACVLLSFSNAQEGIGTTGADAARVVPGMKPPSDSMGVATPGGAPILGKSPASGSIIDISQLGANTDFDTAPVLKTAWEQACLSPTPVKIVIPPGNYTLSCIEFNGPCKAPITFEIAGNFQAPKDVKQFNGSDTWIRFQRILGLTITAVSGGGIFDGNGEDVWSHPSCSKDGTCDTRPYNLRFFDTNNSVINGITSLDSKQFHTMVLKCENLTIQNMKIKAPEDSRNTDGVHVARSVDIRILDTDIQTGDDCVSVGDGTRNLTIERVSCGPGHGISIGSLGKMDDEDDIEGIFVTNCSLKNADNGIRIKSWLNSKPCSAREMHFQDITMENVSNPILIDQAYCPSAKCDASVPSQVKISDVTFKNIKGTASNPSVLRLVCSSKFPCKNVNLEDISLTYDGPRGEALSECCNVKPKTTGSVIPPACAKETNEADAAKHITAASKAADDDHMITQALPVV